jgi:hypothetical protein
MTHSNREQGSVEECPLRDANTYQCTQDTCDGSGACNQLLVTVWLLRTKNDIDGHVSSLPPGACPERMLVMPSVMHTQPRATPTLPHFTTCAQGAPPHLSSCCTGRCQTGACPPPPPSALGPALAAPHAPAVHISRLGASANCLSNRTLSQLTVPRCICALWQRRAPPASNIHKERGSCWHWQYQPALLLTCCAAAISGALTKGCGLATSSWAPPPSLLTSHTAAVVSRLLAGRCRGWDRKVPKYRESRGTGRLKRPCKGGGRGLEG